MKAIVLLGAVVLAFLVMPVLAYANCTTQVYYIDGRMLTCMKCCTGVTCTTSCY